MELFLGSEIDNFLHRYTVDYICSRLYRIVNEENNLSKTRAIRLSTDEDRKIEEFLKSNPFFDFSSLARIAIISFVENPKLDLTPIKQRPQRKKDHNAQL